MKLSIVKRLIEALCNYEQGGTALHQNRIEFTVFGVLCDLYLKDHRGEWGESKEYVGQFYTCLGWVMYPPPEVDKWAGMTLAFRNKIQQWEDYDHLTFMEITDKLREEVKNAESRRVQNRDTNRPGQGKGRG